MAEPEDNDRRGDGGAPRRDPGSDPVARDAAAEPDPVLASRTRSDAGPSAAVDEADSPPLDGVAASGGRRGRGRGGRRSAYASRDLTEGSIPRNLWFISWPQFVESLLNASDQIMDLVWAGRIGAGSIAGIGVAQTYVQVGNTGRMGLDIAMRAMIARAVGAGDIARANYVALQAFSLSGAFSIIMALIGVFFTEPLLRIVGVPESIVQAGADYMRVQFIGSGANAFRMMTGHALQSAGDAITPMRATMVTRLLHVVLSPFLVFGWFLFPEFGLMGAALANVLSQSVGATMNFRSLFNGTSRLHLTLVGYRPDLPLLWQLLKTGLPASITSAERSFANLFLIGIVSPYGATTLAAFALTRRLEQFVMMGARGFGQGAGILVGQNLGAGKPERARKTVIWAVFFVFIINVFMVAILTIFPEAVIRVFNSDREFLDTAVTWVQIASIGYLFLGVGQVYQQSYNTAGDTLVPMVVTLVSIWFVQQPMAVILPDLGLGHTGIAWAVVLAVFVRLLIYAPYYFTDRWLRIRI